MFDKAKSRQMYNSYILDFYVFGLTLKILENTPTKVKLAFGDIPWNPLLIVTH